MTRAILVRACCAILPLVLAAGGQSARADDWGLERFATALVPTATPVPEPTATQRYVSSSRGARPAVERWRSLVETFDWDVDQALAVIRCESGGDPAAVNPSSGAAGLLQLLGWSWLARRLFGSGDVLDPSINVGVAYRLWAESGGTFRWHWAASAACWSGG